MARLVGISLAVGVASAFGQVPLRRVAEIPRHGRIEKLLVADSDRDGLEELIFRVRAAWNHRVEVVEYRPVNSYVLERTYRSVYPYPESIVLGNFWPFDIGDIDRDGKADMVGNARYDSGSGSRLAMCVFESRDSWSYPDSLVWWTPSRNSATAGTHPVRYADLDQDSALDIISPWIGEVCSTAIFENVGDDRESLVCTVSRGWGEAGWTVDDYDQNGRMDYTFKWGWHTYIGECTGDNSYALVCSVYTPTDCIYDRFDGRDVDHNGRPEFFAVNAVPAGMRWRLALLQFEAVAEHQYACDTVDTASSLFEFFGGSLCADIDADGLDEIVWACGNRVLVLKPTGPHQYEKVYVADNAPNVLAYCNAADFNGNGYKEIFVAGDSMGISVFEVEAVRVLYPNRIAGLVGGDTCRIRWRIIAPPHCDSVSLFLKTDTVVPEGERFWRLDTIVTGLAPSESSYLWFVPDTVLNWAKVLAIAYGPGWQFDESDTFFSIRRTGLAEERPAPSLSWALSVRPNPASRNAVVSYVVPCPADIRLGLYNAGGRLVRELVSGERAPGRYEVNVSLPAGIYFCRLESPDQAQSRKVVLGK